MPSLVVACRASQDLIIAGDPELETALETYEKGDSKELTGGSQPRWCRYARTQGARRPCGVAEGGAGPVGLTRGFRALVLTCSTHPLCSACRGCVGASPGLLRGGHLSRRRKSIDLLADELDMAVLKVGSLDSENGVRCTVQMRRGAAPSPCSPVARHELTWVGCILWFGTRPTTSRTFLSQTLTQVRCCVRRGVLCRDSRRPHRANAAVSCRCALSSIPFSRPG